MLKVRKVVAGYRGEICGTIEVTPHGLRYEGANVARLRQLVDNVAGVKGPAQAPGGLEGFLGYLVGPSVNNGYTWVSPIEPSRDECRAVVREDYLESVRQRRIFKQLADALYTCE